MKPVDTPDSVHRGCPRCDRHSSGLGVAPPARCYLPASSAEPPQNWPTWYCCAQRLPVSPRLNWLVSVALILSLCLAVFTGELLAPALSCAVRTFLQCVVSHTTLSRRPCGLHQRRPNRLHAYILRFHLVCLISSRYRFDAASTRPAPAHLQATSPMRSETHTRPAPPEKQR